MKLTLSIKQIIIIFITAIVVAIFVACLFQTIFVFAHTGADWVSALIQTLGNIIGGIIGGIVAVIVAAYQIKQTLDMEQKKNKLTSCSMLKLIREEVKDNITLINSTIPFQDRYMSLFKTQLSDDTWRSTQIHLHIKDDLLVKLNVAYKKVSLLKNLNRSDINDKLLEDTKKQFESILEYLKSEILENEVS